MELTPKQIKELKRYSLILQANNLEDGLTWRNDYWEGDGFQELDGPFYDGRNSEQPGSTQSISIEKLFNEYTDNFDTDEFYNEEYGYEEGSLLFTIYADRQEIVIDRIYKTRESEETENRVSFNQMTSAEQHWWGRNDREREIKKLTDDNYVNQLIEEYGNTISVTYEGGGDDGWVNDNMDTEKLGSVEVPPTIETMIYEIINIYHSGYENNEGGEGTITLDLANRYANINHSSYYDGEGEDTIETIKF
jgi:hypothetical protein